MMLFLHRWAFQWQVTVKELLARVDAQEVCWQMAYSIIEPWDQRRGDLRSAIVANTIAHSVGADTSPDDFMPKFGSFDEDGEDDLAARRLETAARMNLWVQRELSK